MKGGVHFLECNLNNEELFYLCKRYLDSSYANGKIKGMKSFGIPVLEVDMGKSIEHNEEKVLVFIRSLA